MTSLVRKIPFRTPHSISSQQSSVRPLCPTESTPHTVEIDPSKKARIALLRLKSMPKSSGFDDALEAAVQHALHIEGHFLGQLGQTWILHDLCVDAIAVGARLKHDIREQYRSPGLVLIPSGNDFPILISRSSPTHSRNSSAPWSRHTLPAFWAMRR
jgi:hypothetical protein